MARNTIGLIRSHQPPPVRVLLMSRHGRPRPPLTGPLDSIGVTIVNSWQCCQDGLTMGYMANISRGASVAEDASSRGPTNAAMAAVIKDALDERGWSPKTVEAKAPTLKWRTIYRIINNQKDIVIQELVELARILDIPADELMRRANAREERDAAVGSGIPDPAVAARYLLDHPEDDDVLVGQLSELASRLGDHPELLQQARDAARYERRQQLLRWLT